jgi:hypothetical protein
VPKSKQLSNGLDAQTLSLSLSHVDEGCVAETVITTAPLLPEREEVLELDQNVVKALFIGAKCTVRQKYSLLYPSASHQSISKLIDYTFLSFQLIEVVILINL